MGGEDSKLEACKETGNKIIEATGKAAVSALTLGKVGDDLSG